MRVTFHPGAVQDIVDAVRFYRQTAGQAVAARLLRELQRVIALLCTFPDLGAPLDEGRRACALTGFPYAMLYRARVDLLRVLALRHHRRQPGFGETRQ